MGTTWLPRRDAVLPVFIQTTKIEKNLLKIQKICERSQKSAGHTSSSQIADFSCLI